MRTSESTPTQDASALRVTCGPPDLAIPPSTPSAQTWRYGLGMPFQVGPRRAGVFCNVRFDKYPAGDFEAGIDAVIFDDLDNVSPDHAVPITRSQRYTHGDTGEARVAIRHSQRGGFVPLGAKRPDGSDHPGAGSGFLLGEVLDFPMRPDGSYDKCDKTGNMERFTEVNHLAYDGRHLRVVETELHPVHDPLRPPGSEWMIFHPALGMAIPDGDDLLIGVGATTNQVDKWCPDAMTSGASRWQYRGGRWRPSDFVPVGLPGEPVGETHVVYGQAMRRYWIEPSIARDRDGSLLFTARGIFDETAEHAVRVWRSTDNGKTWRVLFERTGVRAQAPITINTTADGTPYIVTCPLGRTRDKLCIWPLNEARTDLTDPIIVRDALEQFGPPPSGLVWFMDHPIAATLQLADGDWHNVLAYRLMDRGEHAGADPTPQTGVHLERVITQGPPIPSWRFD